MKQKLFSLIKITSTTLITCALGLEIWQIYSHFTDTALPKQLSPLMWLASIALIGHLLEGAIAAWKVSSSQGNFITYGIYTFFVGFVGLLELPETLSNPEKSE